ncbi:TonB-dependent receptor [Sinomicrobium kalidii]|uniref:TonB-dependent receptor n=1 Tax=Sinomicrobium kalidii TaxID=2900738 RepID=UPI001E53E792|nr:TonB-dependent receptor [Sinomicrobium kalidii]UGU16664.1 TonB-dependent receptor [Sinomicrobium kalidii]
MNKNANPVSSRGVNPLWRYLWTAMKIFLLFIGIGLSSVYASHSSAQTRMNINVKNVTIENLFREIQKNSEYIFFYKDGTIDENRKISVKVTDATLQDIFERVFKADGLTYELDGRQVIVRKKNVKIPEAADESSVKPQGLEISGMVVDSGGLPLPGANVVEKGTTHGTQTDFDGNYSITVSGNDAVLVVSYMGFVTREVPVNGESEINVTLKEDVASLEEVVVVGYGTQKKVNLTGAVSQVSAEAIENRPVANIGQALQGVLPNLNINIPNGSPNATPSFNVRGGTSLSGDSFVNGAPFVLVDGVQMDINMLNPEDIESISVLKDAASAAIYGARAANGVILVTTKKGKKSQKPQITYNTSFQFNRPSARPDLLDAYTIQDAAIKAVELENRTPSGDMYDKRDAIKAYMDHPEENPSYIMNPGGSIVWVGNTRVYDEAVRSAAPMMKHNLSLRGGSERNTYMISLGYQDQEGIYKINTDKFKRYNVLVNVGSEVTDWLGVDYQVSYNNSVYTEPISPAGKGSWWYAMAQEPGRNINMPVKTPSDSPVGEMYTDNILSFMSYGSNRREVNEQLLMKIAPSVRILKDWNLKADFSYRSVNFRRKEVMPELWRVDDSWENLINTHTNPSYVDKRSNHTDQYTLNIYSDYAAILGRHNISLLAGFNQEWQKYEHLRGRGEGLLSPNIPVVNQTTGNEFAYDNESHWAVRGAFYRIKYNYDDRYLLESNGRYDGTSRFPTDRRFKFFPSISGAWRFSEESFAGFLKPAFDELKFRAGYGSLGNQNVSNYIYIPSYGTVSQVNHLFDGTRPVGITPPGLVDPDLTWETSTTLDVGVDMTLFRRLDISFDWYQRKTTDILVAGDKFPAVLGASSPTKNSGAMQTRGWELEMRWRDELKNGFRYNVALNLWDYQSEVLVFDGNPNKILGNLYAKQKMGEIWGYETAGIFQSEKEIEAAPSQHLLNSQWFPGDIRYEDLNGDGEIGPGENTVENPGDKKVIGNSTPRYQFGLNMNAFWKNFDLNIFFQGVGKRDFWIGDRMYWGGLAGATGTWDVYNNSWTPERTDAYFPAYKNKGANRQVQTRYLQDASYIRLKNLALGYSLPDEVTEKLNIKKLRVSASAYNIWEYTDVPDLFDPELMSANYPMMRSFALGLQVTF